MKAKIEEIWERYKSDDFRALSHDESFITIHDFLKAADEIECFVKNQCNQNYLNNRLQRDTDIQLAILNKGVSYLGLPRNIRDEG